MVFIITASGVAVFVYILIVSVIAVGPSLAVAIVISLPFTLDLVTFDLNLNIILILVAILAVNVFIAVFVVIISIFVLVVIDVYVDVNVFDVVVVRVIFVARMIVDARTIAATRIIVVAIDVAIVVVVISVFVIVYGSCFLMIFTYFVVAGATVGIFARLFTIVAVFIVRFPFRHPTVVTPFNFGAGLGSIAVKYLVLINFDQKRVVAIRLAPKSVQVQLSLKRFQFRMAKILRQDLLLEGVVVVDEKPVAVAHPRNYGSAFDIVGIEDVLELLRKFHLVDGNILLHRRIFSPRGPKREERGELKKESK
mmetsp:Transcript_24143/g.54861  ORF Transcript_24143/g.54861 Transcript_24143/m.54861 type:complete len:309 (+) Transcript_24143:504-1430(+)